MVAWDTRKMELINVEVGRMREATQLLNGYVHHDILLESVEWSALKLLRH